MRARSFYHLCEHKTIYLGAGRADRRRARSAAQGRAHLSRTDLPQPEDLRILNSRPKTSYAVSEECLRIYARRSFPTGAAAACATRSSPRCAPEWRDAYDAGHVHRVHGAAGPRPYGAGRQDLPQRACSISRRDIAERPPRSTSSNDPEAFAKREQLRAMDISCDAVILFARAARRAGPEQCGRGDRSGRARPNWKRSPTSATTCRPTPRAISTRRCNTTGSATWR